MTEGGASDASILFIMLTDHRRHCCMSADYFFFCDIDVEFQTALLCRYTAVSYTHLQAGMYSRAKVHKKSPFMKNKGTNSFRGTTLLPRSNRSYSKMTYNGALGDA